LAEGLPACLTHGKAWRRQHDQNGAKADEHEASADPIPGEPSAEQNAPRQPGLVISLGFGGGLHPGLTALLQIQPGDARALLLLTGLVAALVLAGLGYRPFYVFYRRYVRRG
jgi:hypothetical protein